MNDAPGAGGASPDGAPVPRPGAPESFVLAKGRDLTVALLRPVGAAIVLLIGYFLLPINRTSDLNILGLTVGAFLLASFCVWEVRKFARSVHPLATAMEMLVALSTFYVVVFATTYYLFSEYDPGSFNEYLSRVDALYFCLTVFTTTGFGDIAAYSQGARIAVSIQMASTLVLLGLGLRFLNLLINQKRQATGG